MEADVYWVKEVEGVRLAIMSRPRAGEWLSDEVSSWRRLGLDTIVSLLDAEETRELGLETEAALCATEGLEFHSHPISDRGVPRARGEIEPLVRALALQLREGRAVGIHCRAGIGRSGLLAACVLGALGVEPNSALSMLGRARGVAVPDTEAQKVWVEEFGSNYALERTRQA